MISFLANIFDSWEWWQLALLFFFAILLIALGTLWQKNQNKKKLDEALERLSDFQTSQKIIGENGKSGLAVDEAGRKVCLIKLVDELTDEISLDVLSFSDILSSEIFEDGVTVTKTSRTSQVGGALIGGLALGGVGAMIGGLSGKTTSSEKISKIDLRLTVNRMSDPIHDINFLDVECQKNGMLYTPAMEQARRWHGIIAIIIKREDTEDFASASVYVHKDGVQYGPYSAHDLGQYVKQGSFSLNDHACYDGKKWVTISQVPGVAESMIA